MERKNSFLVKITPDDTSTSESLLSSYSDASSSGSDTLLSNDCFSDRPTSSCGYPALSVISRSPSPRSIPDTPQIYRIKRISKRKLLTNNKFEHERGSAHYKKNLYGSRSSSRNSSTSTEKLISNKEDYSKNENTTSYLVKPLQPEIISMLKSLRPKSAPEPRVQKAIFNLPNKTNTNEVSSHEKNKADLSKSTTIYTQTDFEDTKSSLNSDENCKLNIMTQTYLKQTSVGVQVEAGSVVKENKSCQTVLGSQHVSELQNKSQPVNSLNKLRTNSAHCSRQIQTKENLCFERCKSAIAILITRTRISSSSGERRKEIRAESAEISFKTSSEISSHLPQEIFTEEEKRFNRRFPVRPHTSFHPPSSGRNRLVQNQAISSLKLANLKKAYGRRNVNMSGLNVSTKKLRLPMYCGYRCMSTNQVEDIVNRLSSCHLSCGRTHDCRKQSNPEMHMSQRCHTSTPFNDSLLRKSYREIDDLSAKSKDQREKLRQRKNHTQNKDCAIRELEEVVTKSIRKIDNSLMQAKTVLSSLSDIIDSESFNPVRRIMRSHVTNTTSHSRKFVHTRIYRPQTWNSPSRKQNIQPTEGRSKLKDIDALSIIVPAKFEAQGQHKVQLPSLNITSK